MPSENKVEEKITKNEKVLNNTVENRFYPSPLSTQYEPSNDTKKILDKLINAENNNCTIS